MSEIPYYKIETSISTDDHADEGVQFILYLDELQIKRDGSPANKEKGYDEITEVDLSFNIERAYELKDFLNFALRD